MFEMIRTKVFVLSGIVAIAMIVGSVFTMHTMGTLATNAETRDLAQVQVSKLYGINLLLSRELAGAEVREQLDFQMKDFEVNLSHLGAIASGSEIENLEGSWREYSEGVNAAVGHYDTRAADFKFVTQELPLLLAKI